MPLAGKAQLLGLMIIYASSAGVISDTVHFILTSVYSHSAHQTLLISQLIVFLSTRPLHLQPSHSPHKTGEANTEQLPTRQAGPTPNSCQQGRRAKSACTRSIDNIQHLQETKILISLWAHEDLCLLTMCSVVYTDVLRAHISYMPRLCSRLLLGGVRCK